MTAERKPRVRNRARTIQPDAEDVAPKIPLKIRELALEAYHANQAKNEAGLREKKARAKLLGEMAEANFPNNKFSFEANIAPEGKPAITGTLNGSITQTVTIPLDVAVLKKLVDSKTFMAIVSANQASIKKHAGEVILEQCKGTPVYGSKNSKVELAKG